MEKSRVWWYVPVIPVTMGCSNRRIMIQAGLRKKQGPISKITSTKKGWGHNSRDRISA
jgi:hypothetical protein